MSGASRHGPEVRAALARQQPRITQQRLADELGRSQAYVARRVTGELPFDVDDLEAIARYLHIPITDLLPRLDSDQEPAGSWRVKVA